MGVWVHFPEYYVDDIDRKVEDTEDALVAATKKPRCPALQAYALLVVTTATSMGRAITYLEDCGSPEHARGRLLLRAAERALRQAGAEKPDRCPEQDDVPL